MACILSPQALHTTTYSYTYNTIHTAFYASKTSRHQAAAYTSSALTSLSLSLSLSLSHTHSLSLSLSQRETLEGLEPLERDKMMTKL
jgi:hypothetical protein